MSVSARMLRELNLFLMGFFVMSALAFLLLNAGAFGEYARYAFFLRTFASSDLSDGDLLAVRGGYAASVSGKGTRAYELRVPKIGVTTPIVLPKDGTKSGILAAMEEGVALYPGSDQPGGAGRAVVLGHSSRASWYRGNYATVFALLGELSPGDTFTVRGPDKTYEYKVVAKKVLTPADTNALLAGPASPGEIELITCYPVGGASKRTVIQAVLIP